MTIRRRRIYVPARLTVRRVVITAYYLFVIRGGQRQTHCKGVAAFDRLVYTRERCVTVPRAVRKEL